MKLPFNKKLVNQTQIARILKVDPSHVNKILNGKYRGRPEYAEETIKRISKILKAA